MFHVKHDIWCWFGLVWPAFHSTPKPPLKYSAFRLYPQSYPQGYPPRYAPAYAPHPYSESP
jgi:hypothetical protein